MSFLRDEAVGTKREGCILTGLTLALLTLLPGHPAGAQTFSSGSTGALGAFAPASDTTVTLPADGILNYTTVTIPTNIKVTFTRNTANTPVTLLATGDVTISGTVDVSGTNSNNGSPTAMVTPGSPGGPGGFAGGQGGTRGLVNRNGAAGLGLGGGYGESLPGATGGVGLYGVDPSIVTLIPMFGGSGGGAAAGDVTNTGAPGGGGGGAIVMASSTRITINSSGLIKANGGDGTPCSSFPGQPGSGGAIRLVAPQITGPGTVQAVSGGLGCPMVTGNPPGIGRIRLEATTLSLSGPITPAASVSTALGPVAPSSTPPLVNVPTVLISQVGAITATLNPNGSYSTPDLTLSTGTVNPVTVTVAGNNVPVGTQFTVRVIPQFSIPINFTSTPAAGTFGSSTATANVNFPYGQTSLLMVYTSYVTTAGLFPLIDGEEIERVMVAANYGGPSTVLLITKSGKEVRAEEWLHKASLASRSPK